eukprot:566346-Rhodomonas_salina.2
MHTGPTANDECPNSVAGPAEPAGDESEVGGGGDKQLLRLLGCVAGEGLGTHRLLGPIGHVDVHSVPR